LYILESLSRNSVLETLGRPWWMTSKIYDG
jgi:hypothetical protein